MDWIGIRKEIEEMKNGKKASILLNLVIFCAPSVLSVVVCNPISGSQGQSIKRTKKVSGGMQEVISAK